MSELPSGTVTFLFTDIEGSTRLWEEHAAAMRGALALHDEIVRAAVARHHGHVVKTTGDGFHCAFASAHDCLRASALAQSTLESTTWPDDVHVRVRMGIHTGETQERDGDYYGPAANRAARVMALAHGGQVVVSGASRGIVADSLDDGFELVALGDVRVRGVPQPIAVYQLAGPGLAREFPPLVTPTESVGNLPAAVSSFVGREEEVAEVVDLLADSRMVTLTGVGGVGKTRMALEVAAQAAPAFRDGAWVVELARVRDPDAVATVISATLRAAGRPELDPVDALTEFLATKEILVVLDNCEHLLDGVVRVVRALLPQCERLRLLATSREGLAIRGERIVAVPSLEPESASELFTERARDAKDHFAPSSADQDAIVELCARLDGIPLAIELAAARITALSPAQIAARLDQRFRLLAGGERGAVERHATLRAAIDWSYDLLSAPEQTVLQRLSVFAGTCTLDAAEAVCSGGDVEAGDVLDLVSSLVARSLVVAHTDGSDPAYGLLETIRQYAEQRLDPDDLVEARDRHAAYYARFLERAGLGLQSSDQLEWIRRIERETENVRVAYAWMIERDRSDDIVTVAAALSISVKFFLVVIAVLEQAEEAVAVVRRSESDRLSLVLAMAGWSAANRGDFERAEAHCAEAEELCGDPDDPTVLEVMQVRMLVATAARDIEAASRFEQRMVDWARRNEAPYALVDHLTGLSAQQATLGQLESAIASAREALEVARAHDDVLALPGALTALALAVLDDDPDAARQHLVEAEEVWERYPDLPVTDVGHLLGAIVAANLGDELMTLHVCDRAFRDAMGGRLNQAVLSEALAGAIAARTPEASCVLYGIVEALNPELAKFGAMAVTRARATQIIDGQLDAAQVAALRARGGTMTPVQAVDFARACIDEGLAAYE